MKMRMKALFLAAALTCSAMSTPYLAEEVETEFTTETAAPTADAGSAYAQVYEQLKSAAASNLEQLSAMTDAQLDSLVNGTNASSAAMAARWQGVKDELGSFVEVTDQTIEEDGNKITVVNKAKYDGVGENTDVTVEFVYDMTNQTASANWDIKYPMSKLMTQAGLNTLMGLGIVFLALIFLSFLIKQMHWIPEIMDKKAAEKAAAEKAAAPAPVVTAEPEPEVLEEEDDEELVAVIAAAIAAFEGTSTDGFVVRSIRKANRRSAL